jgi:outer membrane protein TolC
MFLCAHSRFRRPLAPWLLLAAACGLAAAVRAQESDPAVDGTLPEDYLPELKPLIDRALKESPDLIASELRVEVAEADKMQNGLSNLLPHVGSYVQYGVDSQAVSADSGNSTNNQGFIYDANASQPIFQWGALKNTLADKQIEVAISEKNYAEGYRGFIGALRNQYLGLVGQKIALRNLRLSRKIAQDALTLANQQLQSGALPSGAIAGPHLADDQAQLNVELAEQAYAVGRRDLARELARKEIADESIALDVPAPRFAPATAQALLAEFLSGGGRATAAVQLGALNVSHWDLQYRIAKVNLLPKLSVRAEINQQNQSTVVNNTVQQTFITSQQYYVVANWNIFDGFATRGQKRVAFYEKQVAEHDLKNVTDATLESAQNAEKALEFAWRQLAITDSQAQIAEGEYRQTEEAVQRGSAPATTLDSARSTAYAYQTKLVRDRSTFLSDWSAFVSLVGRDPAMRNLPSRYVRQD